MNRMAINKKSLKFEHVPKRTMRVLSFPGPVLSSENRSVQGDLMHSCTQSFGLGPKFPLSQSLHANHSGGEGKNIFVIGTPVLSQSLHPNHSGGEGKNFFAIGTPGLSQSLHANHSGGEMPLGRMDWSRTDFWLAVGTGKNRSSTTTSPCTPYPLPSELQGDKVGKDYLLQNLHLDMRTGLSNAISPQPVSITLSRVRLDYKFRDYLQGTH